MDSNPKSQLLDGNWIPLIGLGCQSFKPNDKTFNLNDFLMKAVQAGYTHFDITNNEVAIGEAFRLIFQAKKQVEDQEGEKVEGQFQQAFPRQKMFISYKVFNNHQIEKSVKHALQAMKLEYFDLVMLNCPTSPPPPPAAQVPEGSQPPAEGQQGKKQIKQSMKKGWQVLQNLKDQGFIRSIGVANFSIQALMFLHPFVKHPPVVNQIECHPFLTQKNLHQLCKKLKIVLIAYCPLLRGGKDQKQPLGDKVDYFAEPVLKELAGKYSKTIPQVILNWQICRGVAVIPKTQKLDHLHDNFNVTDFQLLEEDRDELEKLDKNGKIRVYQLKNLPIWKGEDPLC